MGITDVGATSLWSWPYITHTCTWTDKTVLWGATWAHTGSARQRLAMQTIALYVAMNATAFNRISSQFPGQHLSKRTHEVSGQEEIWACIRSWCIEAAATEPLHQSDFSRPSWYCLQSYSLLSSGIFVYVLIFPTHFAAFCSQKLIATLFTQAAKCITLV